MTFSRDASDIILGLSDRGFTDKSDPDTVDVPRLFFSFFQMVARLDSPQPVFAFPSGDEIPDNVEDQTEPGIPLVNLCYAH